MEKAIAAVGAENIVLTRLNSLLICKTVKWLPGLTARHPYYFLYDAGVW